MVVAVVLFPCSHVKLQNTDALWIVVIGSDSLTVCLSQLTLEIVFSDSRK